MKITYDERADALYIRLRETDCQCRVVRLTDEIALDFTAGETLVGIEILEASKHVTDPRKIEFQITE